jgi:hypothetical protein
MIPFLQQKFAEVATMCGGPDAFQAVHLARVDPAVLEELSKRLLGKIKG